jgi:hypothetical protein
MVFSHEINNFKLHNIDSENFYNNIHVYNKNNRLKCLSIKFDEETKTSQTVQ